MTNRAIVWFGIVILSIAITAPLLAAVQAPAGGGGQRGPAPAPTNLQVLPKDMTRQQVVMIMQQFTMGLGVTCNYCHAEMAGAQPGPNGQIPIDAASDEKQAKKTARVMMKLVGDINNTFANQLGKPAADVVRVQCMTCHRGAAVPKLQ